MLSKGRRQYRRMISPFARDNLATISFLHVSLDTHPHCSLKLPLMITYPQFVYHRENLRDLNINRWENH